MLPAVDRRLLDTLLLELFHMWCASPATKAASFIGEAMRLIGGEHANEQLRRLASEPTIVGRHARTLLDR